MRSTGSVGTLGRLVIALLVLAAAVAAGWFLFIEYPQSVTQLLGVVLVLAVAGTALRFGSSLADTILPSYSVAEVAVEGPISRDGGRPGPLGASIGDSADDLVEQIERADDARGARALLVKLNTPGGEIIPSEDIANAVEDFDGPTVGYATDVCASGGYEIASACDEVWAREGSIVGSIGVIGSRFTAVDLADKLGVEYQQFTAGEFKDAGTPFRELRDEDREYLQGLIDEYYDQFVEDIVERRALSAEDVRETEAKVYLGERAAELGLVDELGTRDAVLDHLETELGEPAIVREFSPAHGLAQRFRGGAQSVAFALGAGITDAFRGDIDGVSFRR